MRYNGNMMKQRIEQVLRWTMAIVIVGVCVHAPLSVVIGVHVPAMATPVKAWKELVLIAELALLLWYGLRYHPRRLRAGITGKHSLPLWLGIAFMAVHGVSMLLFHNGLQAMAAGFLIDVRAVLAFSAGYIGVLYVPHMWAYVRRSLLIGAVIVLGFGCLQLLLPPDNLAVLGYDKTKNIAPYLTVDQNEAYVRINSTLRGPNPLGVYAGSVLVIALVALIYKLRQSEVQKKREYWWLVALIVMAGVVLWVSYSRSAQVGAAVAAVAALLYMWRDKLSWKVGLAAIMVTLALGAGAFALRDSSFISHVVLHKNPHEANQVDSNEGHGSSLQTGITELQAHPLGAGVGTTGSASLLGRRPAMIIENQYLFVAHEVGWVGLVIFMAWLGAILADVWRVRRAFPVATVGVLASGLICIITGMLLPVFVDDTVTVLWFALAGVILGRQPRTETI